MNAKKRRITTYIAGGFAAAVALLLCVFFILIFVEQIHPRAIRISIRTDSATGLYNGEALTADGYNILSGHLRSGDTLTVTCTGKQTLVGTSPNTATALVLDENGVDVTDRYIFEFNEGTLTVDPRPLYVSSSSSEKIYDGTPLIQKNCSLDEGTLVDGHVMFLKAYGEQTIVGKSLNLISVSIMDLQNNDVTNQYRLVYTHGTLTVTPRPLTITSADAQKIYDGTPLTNPDWALTAGTLCEGEYIEVAVGGSQTMYGQSENQIVSIRIYAKNGSNQTDTTDNYEIACYYGKLTVLPPQ